MSRVPWGGCLTLEEVFARLASNRLVDSLILIGSAGRHELSSASDYDLLVVLRQQPVPLRAVITEIDGRMAEIFFTRVDELERILAIGPPFGGDSDDGLLVHWLESGQVIVDRSGLASRAQQIFQSGPWILLPTETERYLIWFKLNDELRQIERLAAGTDPLDRLSMELKLARTLDALLSAYFLLRRIPWRGHKPALRHLAAHDPAFLDLWEAYFDAADLPSRTALFRELLRRALAPAGDLWRPDEIGLQFEPEVEVTPRLIAAGHAFWQSLLSSRAGWTAERDLRPS